MLQNLLLSLLLLLPFFCPLPVQGFNQHERKVCPTYLELSFSMLLLLHFSQLHQFCGKIKNKTAIYCIHGKSTSGYKLCSESPPPQLVRDCDGKVRISVVK